MNRILSHSPLSGPQASRRGGSISGPVPSAGEPILDRFLATQATEPSTLISPPAGPGPKAPNSLLGGQTASTYHGTLYQEDDFPRQDWDDEPLFQEPWLKSDQDPEPYYEESWDEPFYPDQQFHGVGLPRSRDFPLEVRQGWRRCFEATPREFFETLFDTTAVRLGEYSFAVQDGSERWSEVSLEMDLESPTSGRSIGRMDRLFRFPPGEEPSVHHQLLELDPELQGQGVAKELLANSIELYEQAGINRVTLMAALEVGGYAWAKYGFSPLPGRNTRELFSAVRERLAAIDGLADPVRAVVNRLLESDDPKAIWAISDLEGIKVTQQGRSVALGKALLLGTHWQGELRLDDPQARARFDQYISHDPKAGKA